MVFRCGFPQAAAVRKRAASRRVMIYLFCIFIAFSPSYQFSYVSIIAYLSHSNQLVK